MNTFLRIASRDSTLAVRQAEMVREKLKAAGVDSEFVLIKSKGDLSQSDPVQTIGAVGIFTKAIDDAVLDGRADIGVHSLKDLPTVIHPELTLACVLEREDPHDVVVFKSTDFTKEKQSPATVATGSARRKAQWLNKFPHHTIVPVRGNVDSRLKKLSERNWDGIILAAAGLKRLNITVPHKKLNWMIPAPGQGAIAIVSRSSSDDINQILDGLNHQTTFFEITAERAFIRAIEAGCSTPVGALACAEGNKLELKAEVLSADGKNKVMVEISDILENADQLGQRAARSALESGAGNLLNVPDEHA